MNKIASNNWYKASFYLLATLLIAGSILIVAKNNIYHWELDLYIPHYLRDISLGRIIFDPICEGDITGTTFRGREVGSLFNYLDAQLLLFLFYSGIPIFISIVNYLALFMMVITCIWFTKIYIPSQINVTYLCILIFLSSPPVVLSGTFYRSNKIVASLGLFMTMAMVIKRCLDEMQDCKRKNLLVDSFLLFFFGLVACLTDEQGLIFTFLIFLCLLIYSAFSTRKFLVEITVLFFVFMFYFLYVKIFGIFFFEYFNEVHPIATQFAIPNLANPQNILKSAKLLVRYVAYIFGNIGYGERATLVIYPLLGFLIFYLLSRRKGYFQILSKKFFWIFIFIIFYTITVIHVMTLKHPPIFWLDIVSYYSLPICTIIFVIFLVAIQYLYFLKKVNLYFLVLIFLLNCISINKYIDLVRSGHLQNYRVAGFVANGVFLGFESQNSIIALLKNYPSPYQNQILGQKTIVSLRDKLIMNGSTK